VIDAFPILVAIFVISMIQLIVTANLQIGGTS